jgi:exosortase/archaeosortase family protein
MSSSVFNRFPVGKGPLFLGFVLLVPPGLNLLQYWLHNPLYGFGLWVPVLAAYLAATRIAGALKWRKNHFPADFTHTPIHASRLALCGMVAYLVALPFLRIVQVANPDWRLVDWILSGGAVVALLSLIVWIGGRALLAWLWLPVCFLLTAVPWSTNAERNFIQFAVPGTTTATSEFLWMFGVATIDMGRTLYTAVGPVLVTEDCSGIRSLHLALMASLFWSGCLRLRVWGAVAAIFTGIFTALFLNLLRVAFLALGASWSGHLDFVERWHDTAGTVAQVLLMIFLPLTAWFFSKHQKPASEPQFPKEKWDLPHGWNTISLRVVVMAAAWILASEVTVEVWFRAHEKAALSPEPYWMANKTPDIPGAHDVAIPQNVRENYRYSDSLGLQWTDPQNAPWSFIWLNFEKGALSACVHNIHKPEACLPAADYVMMAQFADLPVEFPNSTMVFKHELFRRGNTPLHLFFAVLQEKAGGKTIQTDWTFEGRLYAAWMGVRSRREEIIHLAVEHPYQVIDARRYATAYFKKIFGRNQ